jgi:protein-S-isoprenylcysteine O-methyltransferase Ste14
MRTFRVDIVVSIVIPVLVGIVYSLNHGGVKNLLLLSFICFALLSEIFFLIEEDALNAQDNDKYIYFLLSIIIMLTWVFSLDLMLGITIIFIVLETLFLLKQDFINFSDTGRAVAFFFSSLLTVSCLFSQNIPLPWVVLSIILIATGIVLRVISKIYMKKNFSYSLRIKNAHELVSVGIYSHIRHPGYLGTLLIICGVTLWLNFFVQLVAMIVCFVLADFRIQKEEKMLIKYFGKEYMDYIERSNRLIPYIY